MAKFIAGKLFYGVVCLLAAVLLVVAGYAHKVVGEVNQAEKGIAIAGGATIGEMNILVMGLESRTNFEGQTLPNNLLTAMHAGNAGAVSAGQVGAQDTDTLILIHIFADGKKAVGISIPRDDLVTYPHPTYLGITQGKIDQAYDFAYNQSLGQTSGSSMSSSQRYLEANQAGQAFEIATVEAVTGVHIDHFVETNLDGFYELASAFGGIEVCVKPWTAGNDANLSDQNSGWNAVLDGYNVKKGGDQYLHLAPAQALAYVRDRDSLPEVDLDRTHRQQAVIDYVIYELKHRGTLSDLSALNSLLNSASQFLITDSTFNLLDFASNMRALTGSNLTFSTLPIASEQTDPDLNGSSQDVNIINVPFVQQYVQSAFNQGGTPASATATPTAAPSAITADVYNGSNTTGLAGSVSQALVALGYKAGAVADSTAQSQTVEADTQVFYGAGAAGNAASIANEFGTTAQSLPSLPADHVEVLLGSTTTSVPAGLSAPATQGTQSTGAKVIGVTAATASPSPAPAASTPATTPGANDGQTGGNVTVAPNAPFGIPCVY